MSEKDYGIPWFMERMKTIGDCTSALKNKGNIGLSEWCFGCLQTFQKQLISEFLDDLTVIDEIDWDKTWKLYADIRKKWEEKLK